jgi:hypothetical protein
MSPAIDPVQTIDDVLSALDAILAQSRRQPSRLGYFAALYRRVTAAVKQGIAAGRFEDGPRMEAFDVIFARRYLDAYTQFQAGQTPARSWQVAFQGASDPVPLVVQQLLAGMNAHINLDLGIAAAEVAPGPKLAALQPDFNAINGVLAEQVGAVQQDLAEVSPMLGLLDRIGQRTDTRLINFSLVKARDCAWATAQRVNATAPAQLGTTIAVLDAGVEILGRLILHPLPPVDLELLPIRAVESDNIVRIIDVLAS